MAEMEHQPMQKSRMMQSIRVLLVFSLFIATAGCSTHFQRNELDMVAFYLKAPAAQNVRIAASYNGYSLQPAERLNAGMWIVRLPKGVSFSYFYLVDGRCVVPECEMMEQDDFGQTNCVFSPKP